MTPTARARLLILSVLPCLSACEKSPVSESKPALTVYCAAGLRKPLEAAAQAFQKDQGVEILFQFGGTGTLLSQIRVAQKGDLLVAADDESVASARKAALICEIIPFAAQTPVLGVKAGNPKGISSFQDLMRDDVKVAIANPESASIGKSVRAAAGTGWEKLAAKVTVMKPTVTEIAADLSLGAVDTAVIWSALTGQFQGIEAVHTPELNARLERASAAVLGCSKQTQAALKFARYLAAPDGGGKAITAAGFQHLPGDLWSPKPEMVLYSGGVNRPAVETLLGRFATREGVTVTTVFNGCGILCASMKTMGSSDNPKFPDAYYACDLCFVPPVAEQFPESVLLTETAIGIVVRNGNPKNVRTLADLAQPDLKVGLCNAEQSTLGYMTKGMLKASALWDSVHKNVVVEVPTADFLINQMRAGALDAALVYEVNVQPVSEHLNFIPVLHAGAKAVQPFAVRSNTPNRQLALRLLDFLKANRQEFEKAGFHWRGDEAPIPSKSIELPVWLKEK